MDIPPSMQDDLAAWNDGEGIDLKSWVGCMGNFSLAVGYATLFWPEFVEFERYVLRADFDEAVLRDCERNGADRASIEGFLNHVHLADLHHYDCADKSSDKLLVLGHALREVYEAKLAWQFPKRQFVVELHVPDDKEQLMEYQLSFWQRTRR